MSKIVFDTSTILSFSGSCLINLLGNLAKQDYLEVIIPQGVMEEAVNKPMSIKRFELSALRVLKGVKDGWINVVDRTSELEEEGNVGGPTDLGNMFRDVRAKFFSYFRTIIHPLHRKHAQRLTVIGNRTIDEGIQTLNAVVV